MIRTGLSIVWLAILAIAPARAAEPVVVAPLRIDYGGWFTVSAVVNGRGPFDFVIDTGATQSLVFESLHANLAFPSAGAPPQKVLGIASAGAFPTYRIDEIAVGAARLENLTTVILPNWINRDRAPQGVLGLDFLERYFCVFDVKRKELRLYERREASEVSAKGWRESRLTRETFNLQRGGLYTLTGHSNNKPATYIIDLGATGTIINKQAFSRISQNSVAISVRPRADRSTSRIMDALKKATRQEDFVLAYFRIGRSQWYQQVFTIYDAPVFDELGVQRRPFGLLGAHLFHDRNFAFDFKGGHIYIGPAGTGGRQ